MKKISLKNLNLKEVDQLSREQLKNVLGGAYGGPITTVDPNPKITACLRKRRGARCSWKNSAGYPYTGTCEAYAPNYVLHCSDLL